VKDQIWLMALSPLILLGAIANKYSMTRQIYGANEMFHYFQDELPGDHECNDLPNKRKWLHKYKRRSA
jgi:hypothetical protein